MDFLYAVYFFVTTVFLRVARNDLPLVEVDQGPVRGQNWKSRSGRTYHSFLGLPYAKPPVGDKRFKLPQPLDETDR